MEGERYTASLSQKSKTALLPRDEKSDRYFSNPDKGPEGDWAGKDPVAREYRKNTVFGIQSPFTGTLHYPEAEYRFDGKIPEAAKHWRLNGMTKKQIKGCLDEWGTPYKEADLGDGCGEALVLAGSSIALKGYKPEKDPVVERAKKRALKRLAEGAWPQMYFRDDRAGTAVGRPRMKNHLKHTTPPIGRQGQARGSQSFT